MSVVGHERVRYVELVLVADDGLCPEDRLSRHRNARARIDVPLTHPNPMIRNLRQRICIFAGDIVCELS